MLSEAAASAAGAGAAATRWQLARLARLHWRDFDGEWVVYDAGSGQTHCLDAFTAAALDLIEASQQAGCESSMLTTALADELGVDADASFQATLDGVCRALQLAGLIEPCTP